MQTVVGYSSSPGVTYPPSSGGSLPPGVNRMMRNITNVLPSGEGFQPGPQPVVTGVPPVGAQSVQPEQEPLPQRPAWTG